MAGYSYVPNPQFRAQQDAYQQKKSQQMASYQNRLLQQESSFRANGPAPARPMPAYRPAPAPGKQPYGSFQPTPRLDLSGYGQQQTSYGPGGLRPAIPNKRNDPPGAIEDALMRYNESKRRREDYLSRNPNPGRDDSFTGTDEEWDAWRGGGYDEVNRQYTPGAAQPNMPPSQGTQYGGWQPAPQIASPGVRSIQGAPGKRSAVVGDMGIFEEKIGTEAFERAIAQGAPQSPGTPYRPQPPAGMTHSEGSPHLWNGDGKPGGHGSIGPQVQMPVPWGEPSLRPQPVYPPDFEGPLPGPAKSREEEIYDQLMAGNFGANLKDIPSAQGRRSQNAREVARRIVGAENAAATSTDRRAKLTYERALRQYGIKPPASDAPTPAPPDRPATSNRPPTTPRPGEAQPVAPQSPGTPYGGGQGNDYQLTPGYMYQQGNDPVSQLGNLYQQQMTAWAQPKQQLLQWGQQVSQMPWGPNYGNTPDNRPSPWSQQVSGQFGDTAASMTQNRDAFIQAVNNQAMQKPVGTYLGQGNPGPQYGKQNYDPSLMMQNAQKLLAGGWQNPFAQQPPGESNFNAFLASQGIPQMPVAQQGPSLPSNAYINAGPNFAAPAGYAYSPIYDKNGNGAGWYDTNAMANYTSSVNAWNAGGRDQAFQANLAAMNDWQSKYGSLASQYKPAAPAYTRPTASFAAATQPPPLYKR